MMAAIDLSKVRPVYAGDRDYTEKLDPSLTLTLQSRQLSGVLAGHQRLSEKVELEVDGYAMDRRSLKQTPFLMTSVDGGAERFQVARNAGVDGFLLKPFNTEKLRAKLEDALRNSASRAA